MAVFMQGVYFDNSVAPWVPISGHRIAAYAASDGTIEGDADTDSNGRFQLTGLTDRPDWVPICETRADGIIVIERLDGPGIAAAISDLDLHVNELLASGQVVVDGRTINYVDDFDAVVDQDYQGSSQSVYTKIADAIAGPGVSIWVISAGDTDPVTIPSTSQCQRLQGKDADTTFVPENLTVNKDDVTIEQLGFASTTLTLGGSNATITSCFLSGTGAISVGAGAPGIVLFGLRGVSVSGVPVTVNNTSAKLLGARFTSCTGASLLVLQSAAGILVQGLVSRNCTTTDYQVKQASGTISNGEITDTHLVGNLAEGGMSLVLGHSVLSDVYIETTSSLTAGKRLLKITDAGFPINSTLTNIVLVASTGTDVIFDSSPTGGDANAEGLVILGMQAANGGTLKLSQGVMLVGCQLASTTIDFQSKTGIVVIGGDMTGATLQNVPADIVFIGVKGQENRTANILFTADTELTISAGAVTVTQSHHTIDTEADAATDELNTINGLTTDQLYFFYPAHTDRTVVLKHNTGNILCIGNQDFSLNDAHDFIWAFSPDGSTVYVGGPHNAPVFISDTEPTSKQDGQLWLDTDATGTGGLGVLNVATITSGATLTTSQTVVLCDAASGAITVTLPAASGNDGRHYHIKKIDSSGNAITIDGNGSETIDGETTQVIAVQYNSINIVCDGSVWHIL